MKKNKKVIFIALAAVLVVGATLGVVAVANANDNGTVQAQSANVSLFDRVAAIYKTNTGATIDSAALQKAFQQAQKETMAKFQDTKKERAPMSQDEMLQKLVDSGKITQKQADDYKAWLAARPALNTDALKNWMDSKPAGIPFGPGVSGNMTPRGPSGTGKMFGR